jgi:hypothetical protein
MAENYIPDEPIIPMLERAAKYAHEHGFSRGWFEPCEKAKIEIENLQIENLKLKKQVAFDETVGELVMQNVEARFKSWFCTVLGFGPFDKKE